MSEQKGQAGIDENALRKIGDTTGREGGKFIGAFPSRENPNLMTVVFRGADKFVRIIYFSANAAAAFIGGLLMGKQSREGKQTRDEQSDKS